MKVSQPLVSIGFPVYNGELSLRTALDSLLSQSRSDFELIISDNASTDGTEAICREYADQDKRIRYVRQKENLGAAANFKYTLDQARGEYFMWAACDDTRSPDYLELNARFLSAHEDYVASTSPNGFEGAKFGKGNLVNFAMDGDNYARFVQFFENCWVSHGIFYSLVRTKVLKDCKIVGESFIAADWAINLYLASRGKIHRTSDGYTIFGVKGISSSVDAFKMFRNNAIEWLLPFYRLTRYVMTLLVGFSFAQKITIVFFLLKLNAIVFVCQLRMAIWPYRDNRDGQGNSAD